MSQLNIDIVSQNEDKSFRSNHLHMMIKGGKINHIIVNTIRRIILEELPAYAFDNNKITIKKNTSVYNNDYIRNRIENLPIPNIENNFDLKEYEMIRDIILNNIVDNENKDENYNLLNMYVKKKNETDEIMNITSNDCEFFMKGEKIDTIYDNPILICKLKPEEEIEFSAVINKSMALKHSRYSLVGICCYEQINENEYIFKFENRNQIKNKEIFNRACQIIIFRLENFLNKIKNKKFSSDKYGKIILDKESHTLGNLLSRGLQDSNDISFASYKKDHLLIEEVVIEYVTNTDKSINEILDKTVNDQIKLYNDIVSKFRSIK